MASHWWFFSSQLHCAEMIAPHLANKHLEYKFVFFWIFRLTKGKLCAAKFLAKMHFFDDKKNNLYFFRIYIIMALPSDSNAWPRTLTEIVSTTRILNWIWTIQNLEFKTISCKQRILRRMPCQFNIRKFNKKLGSFTYDKIWTTCLFYMVLVETTFSIFLLLLRHNLKHCSVLLIISVCLIMFEVIFVEVLLVEVLLVDILVKSLVYYLENNILKNCSKLTIVLFKAWPDLPLKL